MTDYKISFNTQSLLEFVAYCEKHDIYRTFMWGSKDFVYTINISEEQATAIKLIFDCVLEKVK